LEKTKNSKFEIEKLKKVISNLEQEKFSLTQELSREKEQNEQLDREKECTFKNLTEENKVLKRMNETLKRNETNF